MGDTLSSQTLRNPSLSNCGILLLIERWHRPAQATLACIHHDIGEKYHNAAGSDRTSRSLRVMKPGVQSVDQSCP